MFKRPLRSRVLIYGGLLSVASAAFGVSVPLGSPFQVEVVKDRRILAGTVEAGAVENVYRLQTISRTDHRCSGQSVLVHFEVTLLDGAGASTSVGREKSTILVPR